MCLPTMPFKVEKEWEYLGLKCAVTQAHEQGHRCGYVRVPPGHPAHGKSYEEVDVIAHGGVNFTELEPCSHEDGTGYWIGFDFGHMGFGTKGDAVMNPDVPSDYVWTSEQMKKEYQFLKSKIRSLLTGHYWTLPEVEREVERVAAQLAHYDK